MCGCSLQRDAVPLHIPASALIFNQNGLRVATVGADDKVAVQDRHHRPRSRQGDRDSPPASPPTTASSSRRPTASPTATRSASSAPRAQAGDGVGKAGREGVGSEALEPGLNEVVQCAVSFSDWWRWPLLQVRPHRRAMRRMTSGSGRSASCGMPPISKRKRSCSARSRRACASSAMSKGVTSSSSTRTSTRNMSCSRRSAQELLNRKVDLILASVVAAAVAASKLTKDVPIVFATRSGDPAKIGLVESIRRPGGNRDGTDAVRARDDLEASAS